MKATIDIDGNSLTLTTWDEDETRIAVLNILLDPNNDNDLVAFASLDEIYLFMCEHGNDITN